MIDPLVQQAKLTASDGAGADHFGTSVALSGDGNTALVGAWQATIGSNSLQGAAYVFRMARDQLVVYRPSPNPAASQWLVRDAVSGAATTYTGWDLGGDSPFDLDFPGDAHGDYTLYRPSTGTW